MSARCLTGSISTRKPSSSFSSSFAGCLRLLISIGIDLVGCIDNGFVLVVGLVFARHQLAAQYFANRSLGQLCHEDVLTRSLYISKVCGAEVLRKLFCLAMPFALS